MYVCMYVCMHKQITNIYIYIYMCRCRRQDDLVEVSRGAPDPAADACCSSGRDAWAALGAWGFFLSIYLSIYLSIHPSIYLSI